MSRTITSLHIVTRTDVAMQIVTPGGAVVACLRSLDRTSELANAMSEIPIAPERRVPRILGDSIASDSPLASLHRLVSIVSRGQSADEILRDLGAELSRLISSDTYGVLMHDPAQGGFTWVDDLALEKFPIEFIPDGTGIVSAVFHSGQAELVNYATSDHRYWPPVEADSEAKPEHLMVAPLVMKGRAVGIMIVGRTGDSPFTRAEYEMFLVVAEATAGALHGANTLTALAAERDAAVQASDSMKRLLEGHRVITVAPAFGDLVQVLVSELRKIVPCRKLALIKIVGAEAMEVFWSDDVSRVIQLSADASIVRYPAIEQALSTGEIQLFNDLDPSLPGLGGARSIVEPEHLVVVPIHLGDDHYGAIAMTRIGDDRFDLTDANVARSLALHAVVKSRNLALLESTRDSEHREIRSRERVEA
ncbi:MAG: GAF domain-containing protein, partial [Thermomicrobiales bacterium]